MAKSFTQKVYAVVGKILKGKTMSYGEVARRAGHPGAARAVGSAMNKNTPENTGNVPCHRVVCSDGSVGGYAWGERQKIAILVREGVEVKDGRISREFLVG